MTLSPSDVIRLEIQAACRLARLFRIERSGRLGRRPADTVRRLIDRRGGLIEQLLRLEERRRTAAPATPAALRLAMDRLARDVGDAQHANRELIARLESRLRPLRGEGLATGLRNRRGGRLLGHG